jgi:hypothetical protein
VCVTGFRPVTLRISRLKTTAQIIVGKVPSRAESDPCRLSLEESPLAGGRGPYSRQACTCSSLSNPTHDSAIKPVDHSTLSATGLGNRGSFNLAYHSCAVPSLPLVLSNGCTCAVWYAAWDRAAVDKSGLPTTCCDCWTVNALHLTKTPSTTVVLGHPARSLHCKCFEII